MTARPCRESGRTVPICCKAFEDRARIGRAAGEAAEYETRRQAWETAERNPYQAALEAYDRAERQSPVNPMSDREQAAEAELTLPENRGIVRCQGDGSLDTRLEIVGTVLPTTLKRPTRDAGKGSTRFPGFGIMLP